MPDQEKFFIRVLRALARMIPLLSPLLEEILDPMFSNYLGTSKTIIDRTIPKNAFDDSPKIDSKTPLEEKALVKTAQVNSIEISLSQIEQNFQEDKDRRSKKRSKILHQEASIFRVFILFTIVTLVFVSIGLYMFFEEGRNVIGAISESIGLLTGSASLLLKRWHKTLQEKERELDVVDAKQTKYLRVIQTTLALKGKEREEQLIETAKWLRDN